MYLGSVNSLGAVEISQRFPAHMEKPQKECFIRDKMILKFSSHKQKTKMFIPGHMTGKTKTSTTI